MSASTSLAIKNGILFVLVILILHLMLRKSLESVPGPALLPDSEPNLLPLPEAPLTLDRSERHDPMILSYVFGDSANPEASPGTTSPTSPVAAVPVPSPGPDVEQPHTGGETRTRPPGVSQKQEPVRADSSGAPYMMIGTYKNENELCGGNILRTMQGNKDSVLFGFEGFQGIGADLGMVA